MGDAPEAEPAELEKAAEPEPDAEAEGEAEEAASTDAEAVPPPEPEAPGDPKKEWPLAIGIMILVAAICWWFVRVLAGT